MILPQVGHALTGYGARRRLDHFVTHLFHDTPPAGVQLRGPHDRLVQKRALQQLVTT